jgi:hypothetical protein
LLFDLEETDAVVVLRLAFRLRSLRDQDTHDDGKHQYNNLSDPPSITDIYSSGLVHFACGFCVFYSTKVHLVEVRIFVFGGQILHPYPNIVWRKQAANGLYSALYISQLLRKSVTLLRQT